MTRFVRALIPFAALAAMAAFSAREIDPAAAAEGGFLALLSTAVLLAAAVLAPRPAVEIGVGAVLATAAVWALPTGPTRGAVVVLVLAAALAVAAARRLSRTLPALPLDVTIPLALGLQLLLRSRLLLEPELSARTLVALLALPVAGGIATSLLAQRHGQLAALAAATAVVLAPGWNVASTLGLIALAAGDFLARPDLGRPARLAAFAVLLAPIAWDPWTGAAIAIAGLALAFPLPGCGLAILYGIARVAIPAFFSMFPAAGSEPLWILLLVPAVFLFEKGRGWTLLAAVFLSVTVPLVPDPSALAAPLALAVLTLRRSGAAVALQRAWTAVLLGLTALLAGYPWLREGGADDSFLLLGWQTWSRPVAAVLLPLGFFAAAFVYSRRPRLALPPGGLVMAALFAVLLLRLVPSGTFLIRGWTVALDAAHPSWEVLLPPGELRTIAIESSLSNGARLENGTPVAVLKLEKPGGPIRIWALAAGSDTGEWAALRPDVAGTARLRSPAPWVSWVAGDFLGQRYRRVWSVRSLPGLGSGARLRIERAPGLPADVLLSLYQVEVRP